MSVLLLLLLNNTRPLGQNICGSGIVLFYLILRSILFSIYSPSLLVHIYSPLFVHTGAGRGVRVCADGRRYELYSPFLLHLYYFIFILHGFSMQALAKGYISVQTAGALSFILHLFSIYYPCIFLYSPLFVHAGAG